MLWFLCPVRWPPHSSEVTSRQLFSFQVSKSYYGIDITSCVKWFQQYWDFLFKEMGKMRWHVWWVHHDSIIIFLIFTVILDVIYGWRWNERKIHRSSNIGTFVSRSKQKRRLGIRQSHESLEQVIIIQSWIQRCREVRHYTNKPNLATITSLLAMRD